MPRREVTHGFGIVCGREVAADLPACGPRAWLLRSRPIEDSTAEGLEEQVYPKRAGGSSARWCPASGKVPERREERR